MPVDAERCRTCYGTGEIVTDQGASNCPDCYGDGRVASGAKLEWRLRDLEKTYRTSHHECFADLMWLVHELRQARDALVVILSRCQDADDGDELARYVRAQAIAALGLYSRQTPAAAAAKEKS